MVRFLAAALVLVVPTLASAAEWLTSYAKAYEICKDADKPIFVYFTDSAADKEWQKPFEELADLTDKFVLVVADKSTQDGAKLLDTFEFTKPSGAVVIDRTRQWQFFRTNRQLKTDEIKTVLTESKEATGKPANSVLKNVSEAQAVQSTFDSEMVQPATYCPNCRRYR